MIVGIIKHGVQQVWPVKRLKSVQSRHYQNRQQQSGISTIMIFESSGARGGGHNFVLLLGQASTSAGSVSMFRFLEGTFGVRCCPGQGSRLRLFEFRARRVTFWDP